MDDSPQPEHGRDGDAQPPLLPTGEGGFRSDRSGWDTSLSLMARQMDREARDFREWRNDLRRWGDGLEARTEALSERLSVIEDRVEDTKAMKAEIQALKERAHTAETRIGHLDVLRGKIDLRRLASLATVCVMFLGAYDRFRIEPLEREQEARELLQSAPPAQTVPLPIDPKESGDNLLLLDKSQGVAVR